MEARSGAAGLPYPVMNYPQIPPGLESLYGACIRIYPDQPNPLQVTAVVKYWLGGPDPLDYISMYSNPGDPSNDIPPHWHYVSFGLSDLHGDGRVHDMSGPDTPSGFGFELSFRLQKEPDETAPPTWPAAVMQGLAKYVFQSGNVLCDGDHVSWHCPLDNSESRIQHMLMTEDSQLGSVMTPFGSATFIQIVGVCAEELKAAQQWNGRSFINLMKSVSGAGGPWLVTDMRRGETVFELDPAIQEAVDQGIENEGSDLSGVSAKLSWIEEFPPTTTLPEPVEGQNENDSEPDIPDISEYESEQIKATLKKGLLNTKPVIPPIRPHSSKALEQNTINENDGTNSRKESYDSNVSNGPGVIETGELSRTKYLDSLHVRLNLEAGLLIPLALRGRLKHGRHFTFKSCTDYSAITLVVPSVLGAFADGEHPYAVQASWLQVLLTEDFIEEMIVQFDELNHSEGVSLPKTYTWPERKVSITLLPEEL